MERPLFAGIRVQDMPKIPMVIADMRKLIRQDQRIIQRLHRRVFLDKMTREQITIYISFYVEAANRDAFMSVKQDLLLAFVECIDRNGAYLARNRLQVCLVEHTGESYKLTVHDGNWRTMKFAPTRAPLLLPQAIMHNAKRCSLQINAHSMNHCASCCKLVKGK